MVPSNKKIHERSLKEEEKHSLCFFSYLFCLFVRVFRLPSEWYCIEYSPHTWSLLHSEAGSASENLLQVLGCDCVK